MLLRNFWSELKLCENLQRMMGRYQRSQKKPYKKNKLMGGRRECWRSESSVGIGISQLVGILWLFEVFFTGGEFRGEFRGCGDDLRRLVGNAIFSENWQKTGFSTTKEWRVNSWDLGIGNFILM
jgi:hypothetical protein